MAAHHLQRTINNSQKTIPYAVAADASFAADFPINESLVELRKTAAGDSALTLPSLGGDTIQTITFVMVQKEAGSGNYTISCLQGTVTFSAIGHAATFIYSSEEEAWLLISAPQGAAVV